MNLRYIRLIEVKNNPEKLSTTKVGDYGPFFIVYNIENKHDLWRGENCIKKLHSINKQQESYENVKFCHICKEKLKINMLSIKILQS